MSLISQNASSKNRVKSRKEENEEPAFMGGDEGNENSGVLDLVMSKGKKRRKEREEQLEMEERKEMKKLENFLFGSLYSPVVFGEDDQENANDGVGDGSALFFVDRSAGNVLSVCDKDAEIEDREEIKLPNAVWNDEEDERTTVDITKVNRLRKLKSAENENFLSGSEYVARLRAQHIKLNPATDWARPASQCEIYDDESSDEETGAAIAHGYGEILCATEEIVGKSWTKLSPGLLEFSRLVDANAQDPSNGPINSVQFHPNGQLLLVAGLDRRVGFFQIDGKRNTKIQTVFLDDCPIRKASFLSDGSQVIIGGRRKFFYSFDLEKAKVDKVGPFVGREEKSLEVFEVSPDSSMIAFVGNEGYILLVSSRTKELIGTLKMNGTARSLAFADDGRQLLSHGGDGQVYLWDLRTRACIHKGVDEGCINGTSLCTSRIGNLFAAGSDSGIVNIYNKDDFLGGKRKPVKTINNLTTKVHFMKFNHDAQILAICSHMKKNSLKLIHVPSFTVFSNWPPVNRTLHYPRCLDFSPGEGFMTLGNASGKVLLYKLHHYHQA